MHMILALGAGDVHANRCHVVGDDARDGVVILNHDNNDVDDEVDGEDEGDDCF